MKLSYLLIVFGLQSLCAEYEHAIYISVLEIDKREMKVKVFTDNLQDAIRNHAYNYIPSTEGNFHVANEQAIEWYFQKKVRLKVNDENVSFKLKEASLEGDSYWITFELAPHDEWVSFELEADYLMELFPDQTNVVKVLTKKPQFFRLTKFFPSCSFTL